MASITVSARSGAPEETAADTRVVGVFEGDSLADPALQRLIELGEAKRGLKKVAVAHEDAPGGGQRRVLIAGLGPRDEFGAEQARVAAAAAAARAKELGAVSLSWAAPGGDGRGRRARGGHAARSCTRSTASSRARTATANGGVESLEIAGDAVDGDEVERGRIAAVAANAARDLQNLPSNVAHADLPGRARQRDRRPARRARGGAVRPRGDRRARHGRLRRGRAGEPRRAAPDRAPLPAVGRERPAPRLRGQGRDLRHRRDLDQALGEDAGDEVRHVGRRRGHRVDGRDRRARRCRSR